MKLRCCPRRSCKGEAMMTQQVIEDFGHRERLGFRVICSKCATAGPWGGRPGLEGEQAAADFWNGDWGRDG